MKEERRELWSLLGELPRVSGPPAELKKKVVDAGDYRLEVLLLDLNGIEPAPAYLARPNSADGKLPVVLYNHAHGGAYDVGKEELVRGRKALVGPPYAEELARMGVASLCIDAWNFGERRGRTESELFKEMLWQGRVLWGMMVFDSVRALDYVEARPDLDASRIATMGISMGSTMAWWLGALDERVKVCIDMCCLTDFHALVEARGLDGHGIYYYVPRLLAEGWTTARINSLIAPRAHLSLAGEADPLTPPAGLSRVDAELRSVYAQRGAPGNWRLIRYRHGHFETHAMRAEVLAWLRERL